MIIPAILEHTSSEFNERLSQLATIKDLHAVQVDFIDGLFLRGRNLAVSDLPELNSDYEWEAHLMVQSPQNFFDYHDKGFKKIIVHYEAFSSLDDLKSSIQAIKDVLCVPAVAINPETPVVYLQNLSGLVNNFTIMSVNPGRQGSAFIPSVYDKIKQLRHMMPGAVIEVDGSVNVDNITLLSEAGADEFAVGSFIFASGNPADNYSRLQRALI